MLGEQRGESGMADFATSLDILEEKTAQAVNTFQCNAANSTNFSKSVRVANLPTKLFKVMLIFFMKRVVICLIKLKIFGNKHGIVNCLKNLVNFALYLL